MVQQFLQELGILVLDIRRRGGRDGISRIAAIVGAVMMMGQ